MSEFKYSKFCFYCGDTANSLDHLVPRCTIRTSSRFLRNQGKEPGEKVAACKECNSLLSDFPFKDLGIRADFVLQKLKKRYKKLLSFTLDYDDFLDIGPGLLSYFNETIRRQEFAKERIAHCDMIVKSYHPFPELVIME